jgi:hypothetical protein
MLAADPARAFYGPGHVAAAAELGAVQTLLISGAPLGCVGCVGCVVWVLFCSTAHHPLKQAPRTNPSNPHQNQPPPPPPPPNPPLPTPTKPLKQTSSSAWPTSRAAAATPRSSTA